MRLRQVCARSFSRPGAHNSLNLGECARFRQVRQVFHIYRGRASKTYE